MGRKTRNSRSSSKSEELQPIGEKIEETLTETMKDIVTGEVQVLHNEIKSLREEITLLKESNIQLIHLLTKINFNHDTIKHKEADNRETNIQLIKTLINKSDSNIKQKTSAEELKRHSGHNMEGNTERDKELNKELINLHINKIAKEKNPIPKADFKTNINATDAHLNNRRPANNTTKVRGITGANKDNKDIKAATKKAEIFVSRIHPSTKITDLQNYLNNDFPESKCEELISKHPEHYRSFKILIDEHHKNQIMDPNFWPCGVYINHFFRRRLQQIPNSG